MAKVTGGLFSLTASGGFAKSLVFASARGVQYVRQLVRPANPRSAGQEQNRNSLRVSSQSQAWSNRQAANRPGQTFFDKILITQKTTAGLAWNSFLVKNMIGTGSINYTADDTDYQALTDPQKTTWDIGANDLLPPMMAVTQTTEGGLAAPNARAGRVYYHHMSALWRMGAGNKPGANPPSGA